MPCDHYVVVPLRSTNSGDFSSGFLVADISLGSPPKQIQLVLDTESAITLVDQRCNEFPLEDRFLVKNFTTVKDLGETSLVSYGTSWVALRWYSDQLSLGNGAKLENFNFGVSMNTVQRRPSSMRILGLRSGRRNKSVTEPPPLLDHMVDSGLVNSAVYSISIGRERGTHGTLLLGGLDTKKYSGSLKRYPIGPQTSSWPCPKNWRTSGGTMEVTYRQQTHLLVDCAYAEKLGIIDFGFGDKTIRVPFRDFILKRSFASPHCVLSAISFPHEDAPFILGIDFFRSAYVVVDQDNGELWLGQADNCGSNVVPVTKGKNSVPILSRRGGGALIDMCPANYTTPKTKTGIKSKSASSSHQTFNERQWSVLSWSFFKSGNAKSGATVQSSKMDDQLPIHKISTSDVDEGPGSNPGSLEETPSDKGQAKNKTPQRQSGEVAAGDGKGNLQHTILLKTQNKNDNGQRSEDGQFLDAELSQPVSEATETRPEENNNVEHIAENGACTSHDVFSVESTCGLQSTSDSPVSTCPATW
ncbi:aspartic peptidase domain-containing protein [Halenospora varia]|nr:aspartic peptidase domain-containing protein [Halenospora varia]